MDQETALRAAPNIALIGNNSLMMHGLKQMLSEVMPFAQFGVFTTLQDMEQALNHAPVFHYFVSAEQYAANEAFFIAHKAQTIVLITNESVSESLNAEIMTLRMLQPRDNILRDLLALQQRGHNHNARYPEALAHRIKQAEAEHEPLSKREKEVLRLLASGMINKEIADRLHISIHTVVTHRKHIMQKLHSQSLSKLAIYAVQHGIISPHEVS